MAKPPGGNDLKNQLGSLWRSTLSGLGAASEAVAKGAQAGRRQIDLTLLRRKRRGVLADLGEVVAKLAADGKIDEEEFPDLSGPLARLEAIDERIAAEEQGRPPPPGDDKEEYDDGDDA